MRGSPRESWLRSVVLPLLAAAVAFAVAQLVCRVVLDLSDTLTPLIAIGAAMTAALLARWFLVLRRSDERPRDRPSGGRP